MLLAGPREDAILWLEDAVFDMTSLTTQLELGASPSAVAQQIRAELNARQLS